MTTHYLDTSIVVSMIVIDAHTDKATSWFETAGRKSLVSSFAKVEFAAAISRRMRAGHISEAESCTALGIFDSWILRDAYLVSLDNSDIEVADFIVRDFATKLLAPDAIHLAAAKRLGATLVTFDERLAEAARRHAVPVVIPS